MAPLFVGSLQLSVKAQRQPRLGAGVLGEALKELTLTFGVDPLHAIKLEVIATRSGRQPDLMQGLLQVDDDLAFVLKRQGDHAAHALVVDVGLTVVVDAVTRQLNGFEQKFCVV